jgi:hypothetical protein
MIPKDFMPEFPFWQEIFFRDGPGNTPAGDFYYCFCKFIIDFPSGREYDSLICLKIRWFNQNPKRMGPGSISGG